MTLAEVLGKRPDALMAYGAFNAPTRIRRLLDFELKHRIPYIDDGATARSTVGFGMDYEDHLRRAASIIAEILKGKPVADIPVDFTSRYLLRVNLKRAREIGIEIPASILLRADTIER
jgi:putative ABC transport system substrate-binding protein